MSLKSQWCVRTVGLLPCCLKGAAGWFLLSKSAHTCLPTVNCSHGCWTGSSRWNRCWSSLWKQKGCSCCFIIHSCCRMSPSNIIPASSPSFSFSPHYWENILTCILHVRCSYMEIIYLGGNLKIADWINFCHLTLIWYRIWHFACVRVSLLINENECKHALNL